MCTQERQKDTTLVCIPSYEVLQEIEGCLNLSHDCFFVSPIPQVVEILKGRGFHRVMGLGVNEEFLDHRCHIHKVIVFENHFFDTLPMMRIIQNSTSAPIIVVTMTPGYPVRLYQSNGARYVVFTKSRNVSCFFN
ncbi:hypothetical protein [Rossellomorea sp. DA94]|uniref:hypothetical protein n=1 Tax=Rossellomorea sp. DA94 TaxID=3038653 RepID=UPI00244B3260|nr:hypothetical protein [Rossellomorea sp. DA94]WGG44766.1 hypothetical protein P8596_18635 [Rossellomorea sp. DA94]